MAEPTGQAYGKDIDEIQENVEFRYDSNGDVKVKGTSKFIENYPEFSKDAKGNFIAIECVDAKRGDEVKFELSEAKSKGEGILNADDYLLVCNIHSNTQTIKFTLVDDEEFNTTFDLSNLVLIQNIEEVITSRDGGAATFNKFVRDLQDTITIKNTASGKGKATGNIKWVTGWSNPAGSEGNWVALHVDNTKLPKGVVKYAIGTSEADPDTNDWNVNIRLDNKSDKTFKIKVDGKVLYELDLSELTLNPNE